MRQFLLAAAFAALACAPVRQAGASPVITPYPTVSAFQAAVPNAVLEGFGTRPTAWNATGNLADAGTVFDYGPFSITREYASASGTGSWPATGAAAQWRGRPTEARADVIRFDRPIYAWGANINTQEGGDGSGIVIFVDFISSAQNILVGQMGVGGSTPAVNIGFVGFRSDLPFDTVRLTTFDAVARRIESDTYLLDNMRYAVPEPAGLALLGAGLLGLGMARRARRKAA